MRALIDSLIYDYNVVATPNQSSGNSLNDFTIHFRYRKLNGSDTRKSLQISQTNQKFETIMSDLLGEYELPDNLKSNFAEHFKFYLERLIRMRRGGVTVAVNLEVTAITSERAEVIQSRMNYFQSENNRNRVVDDEVATIPAKESAVEELERRRLSEDETKDKGEECSICLVEFEKGVEVIKMPCYHVYHTACILSWLHKNHFCPFCRFELPS